MRDRSVGQVFLVFLKLGLLSFGGPIAHLGYIRDEFVTRRRWFSDKAYADLVALCQFLPGPASSQAGIAIGVHRAGLLGGLAAWLAFTLPSAVALIAFAYGLAAHPQWATTGWVHGLKVVAVAVVAQAVWGMGKTLTPDRTRATLALLATLAALLWPSAVTQVVVIALGALIGWRFLPRADHEPRLPLTFPVSRSLGFTLLAVFSRCSSACRCSRPVPAAGPWRSSTPSTASGRWCSAAGTWFCRCCAPRSCRVAG